MRIIEDSERRKGMPGERDLRKVMGGVMLQDRDSDFQERGDMEVVTKRKPTEEEWGELLFAWKVVRHVRSNAIVIANQLGTVGIGAGQMSRVDAVRFAVEKAQETQPGKLEGSVLASDAFFPFADGRRPRSTRASRRSSSRADRSATRKSSPRATPPASRWSSRAAATSATRTSLPFGADGPVAQW